MPKTRRLTDLYVVGKEIDVDDGAGTPVKVWIQKLAPIDHETALRKANAKRAKTLAAYKKDMTLGDIENALTELMLATPNRDELVEFLVNDRIIKLYQAREAELAAEDEWAEEDYLQGLRDAWADELEEIAADNPEDEEVVRVKSELDRFNAELEKIIEGDILEELAKEPTSPEEELQSLRQEMAEAETG